MEHMRIAQVACAAERAAGRSSASSAVSVAGAASRSRKDTHVKLMCAHSVLTPDLISWATSGLDAAWLARSMLNRRTAKLRSQRDVNIVADPARIVARGGRAVRRDADSRHPRRVRRHPHPAWLTMGSIDDARAILSAMMGAVATVLALIFSVALLVLSMVATLFGPRLLYRFLQDWVTQVDDRPVHGHVRLPVPGASSSRIRTRIRVHPADLADHELGARGRAVSASSSSTATGSRRRSRTPTWSARIADDV